MAVRWQDAIAAGRALIGTPYSELDCINFIKKVIRTAPGGVPNYTTAGTNSLWKSAGLTKKYRDLVSYQTGLSGARAGMIAFKASGEDYHHAGIVTDVGTVLHSSSTQGGRGVVETPLTAKEGWTHIATHRYITTAGDTEEGTPMYTARVNLNSAKSSLNLRNGPSSTNRVIGQIPYGAEVDVLAEAGKWLYVRYNKQSGYAAAEYLERAGEDVPDEPLENTEKFTTIINKEGTAIRLAGLWRVAED